MEKNLDSMISSDNTPEIQTVIDSFNTEQGFETNLGLESRIAEQSLKLLSSGEDVDVIAILSAVTAVDCANSYCYKSPPSMPTILYEHKSNMRTDSWLKLKREDKADKSRIIHSKDEVATYLDKVSALKAKHLSNVKTLEQFIDLLLEWGEKDSARTLWGIYNGYPSSLMVGERAIWQKRTVFK